MSNIDYDVPYYFYYSLPPAIESVIGKNSEDGEISSIALGINQTYDGYGGFDGRKATMVTWKWISKS